MNLIKTSIDRPIAIVAAVMMVVMFGLLALELIPIQLTPDINKPVLTVSTSWPGAAPAEVEREILNRQEEELRGLEGLDSMLGRAEQGRARVTLEFNIGQDMDKALLLVSNRLDRIDGYPSEVDKPTLSTRGSEDTPIAWFTLTHTNDNTTPIHTYGDYVEDVIQDRLERVPGVAGMNVYGGTSREMRITVDPVRLSNFGLTVPQVVNALRAANSSASAGDVEEGKRRYVVRTEGELTTIEQVESVVVRSIRNPQTGGMSRVTVKDLGVVTFSHKDPTAFIRRSGNPAMVMNVERETGANVIEIMDGVRKAVTGLNAGPLPRENLVLTQVYDETVYIQSAIDLVRQNIWVGGTLAAIILLLFLRSGPATLIISIAIPVSVIGAFVAMAAMGRSINVISLAGIAFAVGMVVDAAIVVLENIFRLRQEGLSAREAAYKGASQVWGAVLVSALTTVMVFAPILIMQLEAGQLFRDIAVAISVAVVLSLIVAVSVIPALGNKLLKEVPVHKKVGVLHTVDVLALKFTDLILRFTRRVAHDRRNALMVVVTLLAVGGTTTWLMMPDREYLPTGNRNLVFGFILPPPGYNLETTTEAAREIENAVKHLWASETGPESEPGQPPKIKDFFFVARPTFTLVGAQAVEDKRVAELIPVLRKPVFKEPGTFGFIRQPSLFGRGVGGGRNIELDISGGDLEDVLGIALKATGLVSQVLPRSEGHQLRPRPGLELGAPEVRIVPDPLRLADNGVTARDFSQTVDAFNDGLRVAEITVDGQRIDLTLAGPDHKITETQGINSLPVVTANGTIVPVSSLADVIVTSGPTEIRHIERERTVTLQISPSQNVPLQKAIDLVNAEVVDKLRADGLPEGVRLNLAGTADKLSQTWDAMTIDLLLAIAIVYLVMAVLFESFLYPFIIILSVPLATAGGMIGLFVVNLFVSQSLDMLTMLGFIILVGIVVNNAILLVHQTLYHRRHDDMILEDAIVAATQNRIRPIFMSTLTSVFGMLPLVVFPGAGSELYRGLGSVVVGGLTFSAILTLFIIPPLLTLMGWFLEKGVKNRPNLQETV
ncbi:efflux RND transporter permease subunit [Magnetovibrio sp. PR-2]|uniref:efflux RND transporter permease subunit n=1 Tax=Magnetovibrio sp. PR-2 TaxID=3120356 RepID=UPI002FCDFDBE